MSKLIIYGAAQTRAFRALWAAKELGLEFEHVAIAPSSPKPPEFLAVNPSGQVPAIDDGGFALTESMAITLYLAKKHGKLYPKTLEDEARAWQWSFWAITQCEPALLDGLFHTVILPEEKRDAAVAKKSRERLVKPVGLLEQALAGRTHLLGEEFSVADLNVAAIFSWGRLAKLDLLEQPNVSAWLARCLSRPAAKEAGRMGR